MKAVIILAILAVAVAAPHGEDKRMMNEGLELNILYSTVNAARHTFTTLVTAAGHATINFDHVVQLIVPMLTSSTTQAACHVVCVTGSSHLGLAVLGSKLSPACDQVCHGAIAEIHLKAIIGR